MTDVVIQVRVIRGTHFRKEMDICWPDGAVTELTGRKCVLHGKDGNDYNIKKRDEHRQVCEEIMTKQGYSLRRK